MTDSAAIAAIIAEYESHGWKLRRVLLSREMDGSVDFRDAEVLPSEFGGLWFSRRSQPDRESWELRRVSASPFALIEIIPDGLTDQERDELLKHAEDRMFAAPGPKETSH